MSVLSNENDRKGILGTVLFHVILFLIMLITGFGSVPPLDSDNGGVTVSFGEPDMGGDGGAPQSSSSAAPPPSSSEESMVTSESEAPEVDAVEKPVKKTNNTTTNTKNTETTEQKPSIDPRLKAQLEKMKKKTGQKPGEGDEEKEGKEGKPEGTEDGDPDGIGKGTLGKGISYNLKGFTVQGQPNIVNNSEKYGKVVVAICLNKSGRIISTKLGKGSTTNDSYLYNLSVNAIKELKYIPLGELSSETNCGNITIIYERQ